ncbi:histidine phosphatase superfamily branch 2 protein [Nitzschia inconspicua]|nr:histidine phosphatase superfamily branch 2 protein [Nitzschia inconspicua]
MAREVSTVWVLLLLHLLLLSSLAVMTVAEMKLKQIHVINRHGSRTMLPKHPDTLIEKEGATLTPLGQSQLFTMGTWLRQEYSNSMDLKYFNPALHLLESTNLDRAISSANSLALGLFPEAQRATGILVEDANKTLVPALMTSFLETPPAIPVYSIDEDNDVFLRSFRNCPTFQENLRSLYQTDAWKELEDSSEDLLRKLAEIFPENAQEGKVPLKDIWNAYDALNVAVTECTEDEHSCDALVPDPSLATALSEQDFAKVELVAHQVEHWKYTGTETAGNLLGSNLLWKILERAGNGDKEGIFYLYSAHVPTMLGLLGALQAADEFVTATQGDRFIDYGHVFVFEVYEEVDDSGPTKNLYLKLKYKSLDEAASVSLPLKQTRSAEPCGGDNDDATNFCDLEQFKMWALEHTITEKKVWCEACGNWFSDVCLRAKFLAEDGSPLGGGGWDSLGDLEVASGDITTDLTVNQNNALTLTATFLGGLLAGLFLTLIALYAFILPRMKSQVGLSTPIANDPLSTSTEKAGETDSAVEPDSVPSNTFDIGIVANDDASLSTTGTDHLC